MPKPPVSQAPPNEELEGKKLIAISQASRPRHQPDARDDAEPKPRAVSPLFSDFVSPWG